MISILVPVLGRPQNAAPLVQSITSATVVEHEVVFIASAQDKAQIAACAETGARVEVVSWRPKRADYAMKMNHGFHATDREYVFLGSDDIDFHPGWDREVLRKAKGVTGTNDCANRQVMRGYFSTHCLVSRRYVTEQGACLEGPGFIISEAYDHNYVDRELCSLARVRREWAFAPKARVCHRHPLFHRATHQDDTYRKGAQRIGQDRLLFLKRAQQWGMGGLIPGEERIARVASRRRQRYTRARR